MGNSIIKMKEPLFKKYCNATQYCTIARIKMVPMGDGYKQVCPVCGHVHDPENGMTLMERNQNFIDSVV